MDLNQILKPKSKEDVKNAALQISDPNELLKISLDKMQDLSIVKIALERGADPNKIVTLLSKVKNPEIIKTLLDDSTKHIFMNSLVYNGLKYGFEDEIINLIDANRISPSEKEGILVVWSAGFARQKVLIKVLDSNPDFIVSRQESLVEALAVAIARGNYEIVDILLSHNLDPSENNNRAIDVAYEFDNKNALSILLKDKRVLDKLGNDPQLMKYKARLNIVKESLN